MLRTRLRMAGRDHAAFSTHLFPGDGKEAISLALCGSTTLTAEEMGNGYHSDSMVLTVFKVYHVPYSLCERDADFIRWPGDFAIDIFKEAAAKNLKILKIHSHPTGYPNFSKTDDASDRPFFSSISEWIDSDVPGISAIMMPDGSIKARMVDGNGDFHPVESVMVAGDDITIKRELQQEDSSHPLHGYSERTAQAFGRGTIQMLSKLSIGIVGVSGTGSPVMEMLYRSGVGELVLVDGDVIEEKNLNRIYNSTMTDAEGERPKVYVAEEAIKRSGLPTTVVPLFDSLFNPAVVRRLAQCDIIFGCMDSHEGRQQLNTLSTYYCIPYFDLGVGLSADGQGGISQASGNVHYLKPGGSSLYTRRVISMEKVRAEGMKRTRPEEYERRRGEGYIANVDEGSPAVISLNTLIASMAVNDFLARLHPYRSDSNDTFAIVSLDLVNSRLVADTPDGEPCPLLSKSVGRGDMIPLLGLASLSKV